MIKVGINGFGRIGKCAFIQLLKDPFFEICALNVLNMTIYEIEDYLRYDSVHHYDKNFSMDILSDKEFKMNNGPTITLLADRVGKNLKWKELGCEYLIDATGAYLSTEKCLEHDVPYVIMSAPPKDTTATFIYGANHEKYKGEKIISGSSCTTNCIGPMLKILNDTFKVNSCVFTTIHATTASQHTVDIVNKKQRTSRSAFNNIIPHTTGASSSIMNVLPELKGKVYGTSIRVPVITGSLVDVNVELENKNTTLKDIENLLYSSPYFGTVYQVNKGTLVSCDFTTTSTPTILDAKASLRVGEGKFKLMLWYDNEWSYSAQLLRLVRTMFTYNNTVKQKYYVENMNLTGKKVVCRVDFNVAIKDGDIVDDFRISAALPTITAILTQNPLYLCLATHFGRPVPSVQGNTKYSLNFIVPILEKYLGTKVIFLSQGLNKMTVDRIAEENNTNTSIPRVYILENLRFHSEETTYGTMDHSAIETNNIINIYKTLGDVFISDAFGSAHRNHMSICAPKEFGKSYGFGLLIKKEIDTLSILTKGYDKKILCIVGGNKVEDKLPLINYLKLIPTSTVFVAGGIASLYKETAHNVVVMDDALGNKTLQDNPEYIIHLTDITNENNKSYGYKIYDIGKKSLSKLFLLAKDADVIFWNGSLGVIEHTEYRKNSMLFMDYLNKLENKIIIIGGGETASLVTKKHTNINVSTGGGALLKYVQDKILYGKNICGINIFV